MSTTDRKPGPAGREFAVTFVFIALLATCVHFGGPAHLASTAIVCFIYFLFGLAVVRKGLLAAGALAFPFSLLGDPHAMSDTSIHVAQFGLWLGTAVVWVPSLLLGYVLRKRIDRRRPAPEPRKRFKSPV